MDAFAPVATRPAPSHVFNRPTYRVWVDLLGPSTGSIAFLALAVAILRGFWPMPPLMSVFVAAGFAFFGIFMGLGFITSIRRGVSRRMLEVGPAGMWTPEMGFLAWREIAEVRLERVRGPGGDSLADYPKIGIVPVDTARTERAHRSIVYRMYAGYSGLVRLMAPRSGWQDPDSLAPFGVFAYELDRSIGSVVEAIRQYRDVRMPDGSIARRESDIT